MTTLKDLVQIALESEGYEGLHNEVRGCACLSNNLMPCDDPSPWCHAGYRVECPEWCGEHSWHVSSVKRRPRNGGKDRHVGVEW